MGGRTQPQGVCEWGAFIQVTSWKAMGYVLWDTGVRRERGIEGKVLGQPGFQTQARSLTTCMISAQFPKFSEP